MEDRVYTQSEILLELKTLLNNHNIPFWLMTGTLLGAIRDKTFISWDAKDIDVGLEIKYYWKVKEILDASEFKYKWQWNKELAIHKGSNPHPHIDLFFHTEENNNLYCYSYKPNRFTNIWNEEWRMIIDKDLIFPLKEISFLNATFNVPCKTEEYLSSLYGENWSVPDPEWQFTKFKNIDETYTPITAIVTTVYRPNSLRDLVNSFCQFFPEIPLIIGSQNKSNPKFDYPNVTIVDLPEDCGLSYARNALIKKVKTEFTLVLEDDFIVTRFTDIFRLLEVFSYHKDIGIVGGRINQKDKIRSYEKFFLPINTLLLSVDWGKLIDKQIIKSHKINRTTFGIADIIFNFFLAKTQVLLDFPWDDKHKVHSEHIDFFLNLKFNSNCKVAFIPDVHITHVHPEETEEYKKIRTRMYYDLIYKKYGFEKGYTIGEPSLVNYKENKKESI